MTGNGTSRRPSFPWLKQGRVQFAALVAALTGLVWAHVTASRNPGGVVGAVLVMDHLFAIALTCGVLALGAGVGRAALSRFRLTYDAAFDELAYAVAVGLGLIATGYLALGLLGWLGMPAIWGLPATLCILTWRHLAAIPRLLRNSASEIRELSGLPLLALFALIGSCMLLLALPPAADYDSLMYHLEIPSRFLHVGAIHVPAGNLHVAYVGLHHMLYLPFLAAGAPAACAVLNALLTLALGLTLLAFTARSWSRESGRLAAVVLLSTPMVLLVGATPKVDIALVWLLILGHYTLLRAFRSREATVRWLGLAGLLLGFAIGVKHLAVVYVLALVPLFLIAPGAPRLFSRVWLRCGLVLGIVTAATAAPWLLKNWLLLGSPLYPAFTDRILPEWLASLHGTSAIPSTVDPLAAVRSLRTPFDPLAWFLAPERLTPESEGFAYAPPWLLLAVPVAFLVDRSRTHFATALPAVLFVILLLLRSRYVNLRYLMPALPFLSVSAARAVALLAARIPNALRRLRFVTIVAVLVAAPVVGMIGTKVYRTNSWRHAAGTLSRRNYSHDRRNPTNDYWRYTEEVNRIVPGRARMLLLIEGRGYGFDAEVIPDNILSNWPLLAPAVIPPRCLEGARISHVFVGSSALEYFTGRGLDTRGMGWDAFDEFARRCLKQRHRGSGYVVYEVIDRGSAS